MTQSILKYISDCQTLVTVENYFSMQLQWKSKNIDKFLSEIILYLLGLETVPNS